MSNTRAFFITLAAVFLLLAGQALAKESMLVEAFMKAYDAKNLADMSELIKSNKDKIPAEVRALVKEGLKKGLSKEEKTAKFFTGELMAREYNNLTGDSSVLIELKKAEFNSMLHKAVESKPVNSVNTVVIPLGTDKERNVFKPDNLVIHQGETVRWKNNDKIAHIFASMPLIGSGGIFTPSLEGGATWEFKFDKPGEYFYLCFIHKGMIGKITVLPNKKTEKPEPSKKTGAATAPAEK